MEAGSIPAGGAYFTKEDMKLTPKLMKRAIAENKASAARSAAAMMTVEAVEGRKATLTLQVLEHVAHDIWGSADLHFDGDCFQEHEWHVIMRGGTFCNEHRSHASGKTALEAVLAAADVKVKEAKRWATPDQYTHIWSQIDIWKRVAEALEARLPIVRKLDQEKQRAELLAMDKKGELDFGDKKPPLKRRK